MNDVSNWLVFWQHRDLGIDLFDIIKILPKSQNFHIFEEHILFLLLTQPSHFYPHSALFLTLLRLFASFFRVLLLGFGAFSSFTFRFRWDRRDCACMALCAVDVVLYCEP